MNRIMPNALYIVVSYASGEDYHLAFSTNAVIQLTAATLLMVYIDWKRISSVKIVSPANHVLDSLGQNVLSRYLAERKHATARCV